MVVTATLAKYNCLQGPKLSKTFFVLTCVFLHAEALQGMPNTCLREQMRKVDICNSTTNWVPNGETTAN